MSDLKDRLARLGLSQYHQVFAAEGFDTWETVLDITESDLCVALRPLTRRQTLAYKGIGAPSTSNLVIDGYVGHVYTLPQ